MLLDLAGESAAIAAAVSAVHPRIATNLKVLLISIFFSLLLPARIRRENAFIQAGQSGY